MPEPDRQELSRVLPVAGLLGLLVVGVGTLIPPSRQVVPSWLCVGLAVGGLASLARSARLRRASDRHRGALERSLLDMENQAREERESLDSLADGLDVWVLVVDRKGSILYANDRFCTAFEFDNPIGQTILAVTLSRELTSLVDRVAEGAQGHGEVVFQHPRERIALAKVWPATEQREKLFVSLYDVTDLKRLERARRDFVANVSHELRTPMATIRAMAETFLEDPETVDGDTKRYMQKIVSEIDRLTRISNDLLTLSTAEGRPAPKEAVDLTRLVAGAVQQASPKAAQKKLELTLQPGPSVVVHANGEQLTQVLLNLLDNGLNYTTEGGVRVRVLQGEGRARVEVEDTGIGIASEHLPRVFERFYRVDKARSRATGGTGLGLSIVRHIVEAHGGEVGAESTLNVGSTFWFTLPLAEG